MNHDRHDELSERRVADRRISPAIGEFAIQQISTVEGDLDLAGRPLKPGT